MKYAIVESGGKQYRAVEGGTLEVDRLPVEAGANVKLEQILLLADGESITVGTPRCQGQPGMDDGHRALQGRESYHFQLQPEEAYSR